MAFFFRSGALGIFCIGAVGAIAIPTHAQLHSNLGTDVEARAKSAYINVTVPGEFACKDHSGLVEDDGHGFASCLDGSMQPYDIGGNDSLAPDDPVVARIAADIQRPIWFGLPDFLLINDAHQLMSGYVTDHIIPRGADIACHFNWNGFHNLQPTDGGSWVGGNIVLRLLGAGIAKGGDQPGPIGWRYRVLPRLQRTAIRVDWCSGPMRIYIPWCFQNNRLADHQ